MPITDVIEVCGIISELQKGNSIAAKYVGHNLFGNWLGFRDCHIKPDLVLIYKVDSNTLKLARIGSHSDLFN